MTLTLAIQFMHHTYCPQITIQRPAMYCACTASTWGLL